MPKKIEITVYSVDEKLPVGLTAVTGYIKNVGVELRYSLEYGFYWLGGGKVFRASGVTHWSERPNLNEVK